MIKNIIFDLGGVILGRGYHEGGGRLPAFSFLEGDRPFPQYWKDYDRGIITREDAVRGLVSDGFGPEDAEAQYWELLAMFDEFPESVELVRELHGKGYKLYVLSNMPVDFWEHMKSFEVFSYFDGVAISGVEGMVKPEAEFFGLLPARYGFEPGQTLFVDDKPTNTAAAERFGFATCLFKPGAAGCAAVRRALGMF